MSSMWVNWLANLSAVLSGGFNAGLIYTGLLVHYLYAIFPGPQHSAQIIKCEFI